MPMQVIRTSGVPVENSYVVKLKAGTDKEAHIQHVCGHIASLDGLSEVTHGHWNSDCFHGYAGKFSGPSLDALLCCEEVDYVEEDRVVTTSGVVTQKNAPWGLGRISQNAKLTGIESALTFSYSYDATAGSGVDVYVLDTGIYTAHNDFEGRATWGKTFTGTDKQDKNGHGTRVAGIAGGKQFGVAKAVKLIAVKISDDEGSGTLALDIDGLNWVKDQVNTTHRPSIVNMSVNGPYSQAENDTVATLTAAGIHVVVAAGNDNTSADNTSPASAPSAVTVGSTTFKDGRRSDSNFGTCLDVFAPGENIISCGISGPDSTATDSGTSMACPHVAGLAAYLIGKSGNISPADMSKKIKDLSLKNILTDIPKGTVNNLARNDVGN